MPWTLDDLNGRQRRAADADLLFGDAVTDPESIAALPEAGILGAAALPVGNGWSSGETLANSIDVFDGSGRSVEEGKVERVARDSAGGAARVPDQSDAAVREADHGG